MMSLVVVGNHELDVMETFVKEHFDSIENKNLPFKDFSNDPMFDENVLGHVVQYVPIKESRLMTIKWPKLPSVRDLWNGNPLHYLSHSIGHEGENSLLSELIR